MKSEGMSYGKGENPVAGKKGSMKDKENPSTRSQSMKPKTKGPSMGKGSLAKENPLYHKGNKKMGGGKGKY